MCGVLLKFGLGHETPPPSSSIREMRERAPPLKLKFAATYIQFSTKYYFISNKIIPSHIFTLALPLQIIPAHFHTQQSSWHRTGAALGWLWTSVCVPLRPRSPPELRLSQSRILVSLSRGWFVAPSTSCKSARGRVCRSGQRQSHQRPARRQSSELLGRTNEFLLRVASPTQGNGIQG